MTKLDIASKTAAASSDLATDRRSLGLLGRSSSVVAVFLAMAVLGTGCMTAAPECADDDSCGEEEGENEENLEEEEEEEEEEGGKEEEEEAPVCGDGVCSEGETDACNDCATGGGGGASTATLIVANASAYDVWYVYAAPCSSTSWGDDILGDQVLLSGYQATWDGVPPGCYDLRAVDSTEGYWEDYGFTLTAGQSFTWTLNN
jgi:hypothetical protein